MRCAGASITPRIRPISSSASRRSSSRDRFSRSAAYTKPEVRELARELGLPVADKPDSQEICFVPNGDYAAFIDAYFREHGITPEKTQGEIRDH